MFGTLGVQEMLLIFLVALVLFGPRKLPELGKTIGKALTEFRRASNDLKSTFEREMHTLEREGESIKQAADQTAGSIWNATMYDQQEQSALIPPPAEPENQPTVQQPTTVGASEASGAEYQEATQVAGLEGTAPRNGTPSADPAAEHEASETPQHS
jgi:sec-independent protein translocase protein TatA